MSGIEIRKLGSLFFAEVRGVDAATELANDAVAAIDDALNEFGVLCLPGQSLTPQQQMRFSSRLGTLETSGLRSAIDGAGLTTREIVRISNLDLQGNLLAPTDTYSRYALANRIFHSDSSYKHVPSKCSLLYGITVPNNGGNTEFADMRAAYDDLPQATKDRIADLVVEHSVLHSRSRVGFTDFSDEYKAKAPPVQQVLVRTHVGSGRKSLYIGSHASHVIGWPVEEGRALLEELTRHATQPKYVYSHRWTQGDLVIWDNRCMMHRATAVEGPPQPRELHRTTVQDIGNTVELRRRAEPASAGA